MTFSDIFKDSFLDSTTTLTTLQMGVTILISFVLGLFIFQVYKKTYQSVAYTKSFSVSLIMMTMITSLVIMAVTSNIILSLGMVGALSIVRFRAAIKDPMDIVYMFWAIAVGIVTGAGYYLLALIGSAAIGVILYVFSLNTPSDTPYLLIVSFREDSVEQDILNHIKQHVKHYLIRNKAVEQDQIELTIDLRFKDNEMAFITELKTIQSVQQAVLVSNNEFSN